jgi:hypothetical protein
MPHRNDSIPDDMANAYRRFLDLGNSRRENANLGHTHDCSVLRDGSQVFSEREQVQSSHPDYEEELRKETEQAMILYPWQRAFMERVMPIEWCHARYPRVYDAP